MTNYPNFKTMSINKICEEICNNQDLKLDIASNMKTYGGSFIKALSECVITADGDNLLKLTEAFVDYFMEYEPRKWNK